MIKIIKIKIIGDSNQTDFDLKRINEYCEHLTTGVVLNIVL